MPETTARHVDASSIDARLLDAAETGETLEVILVLRGTVRRASGKDRVRWRMRLNGRHMVTFPADAVVAATPVVVPRRGGRR
jgi:TolB-like protein